MKSDAAGYQVRCPVCGLTVEAGRAGLMISGMVAPDRRLGYCAGCDSHHMLIVEKRSDPGDPNTGYAPGYQVRCAECGFVVPAAESGLIFNGGKLPPHIHGPCAGCGREKVELIVEPISTASK